jgi:hypothetical protein
MNECQWLSFFALCLGTVYGFFLGWWVFVRCKQKRGDA